MTSQHDSKPIFSVELTVLEFFFCNLRMLGIFECHFQFHLSKYGLPCIVSSIVGCVFKNVNFVQNFADNIRTHGELEWIFF